MIYSDDNIDDVYNSINGNFYYIFDCIEQLEERIEELEERIHYLEQRNGLQTKMNATLLALARPT